VVSTIKNKTSSSFFKPKLNSRSSWKQLKKSGSSLKLNLENKDRRFISKSSRNLDVKNSSFSNFLDSRNLPLNQIINQERPSMIQSALINKFRKNKSRNISGGLFPSSSTQIISHRMLISRSGPAFQRPEMAENCAKKTFTAELDRIKL
jgi:hypothetical protein